MKVKIIIVALSLLVYSCNREPELKFPYTKEEVKAIALPILEAWKNKDFNTLSEYFQTDKKVEFIHQYYSPMDVVWGPEDIQAIPNNPDWLAYFNEYVWFDYTNATFINYGFLTTNQKWFEYLNYGNYKYENDMPLIIDEDNKNWLYTTKGDETIVNLCVRENHEFIYYSFGLKKIHNRWYIESFFQTSYEHSLPETSTSDQTIP